MWERSSFFWRVFGVELKSVLPVVLFFCTPDFFSLRTIFFSTESQFYCHWNLCFRRQFLFLKVTTSARLHFSFISDVWPRSGRKKDDLLQARNKECLGKIVSLMQIFTSSWSAATPPPPSLPKNPQLPAAAFQSRGGFSGCCWTGLCKRSTTPFGRQQQFLIPLHTDRIRLLASFRRLASALFLSWVLSSPKAFSRSARNRFRTCTHWPFFGVSN